MSQSHNNPLLSPQEDANRVIAQRGAAEIALPPLQANDFGINEDNDGGINLRDLLRILLKRKWIIILFTLIVTAVVAITTALEVPMYRASLTLQVKREMPQVVDLKNPAQMEAMFAGYYDFYQTQYELLRSRSLAEKVNKRLAQKPLPAMPAKPTLALLAKQWWAKLTGTEYVAQAAAQPTRVYLGPGTVGVTPVANSSLVRLSYVSPNPVLTALVVNTFAETYIDDNIERRFGASAAARKFLEQQLEETRIKLEQSERALVDFADKEEIVNIEDNRTLASDRLQDLSTALRESEQQLLQAGLMHKRVQNGGSEALRITLDNPVIQQLKQTKTELQAEYQERLKIYKPAYPAMRQLRGQIDELNKNISTEIQQIKKMVEADYDTALAREETIRSEFEQAKTAYMGLQNRTIHEYNLLNREVDSNRGIYNSLLQRYKEIGVTDGMEINNVSMVDDARVPGAPFSPNIRKKIIMALLLGLFGGVALAFLFERLDDTVKQPEEVERLLGIPVLGIIPVEKAQRGENSDNQALALMTHENPRSTFAEAYRSVRTALQFSTSQGVPKLLVITSAAAHEGKSTTALSLSIQFAQAGNRTLLIDADLRNPSLHRSLSVASDVGLTNYLAADARPSEIAKPTIVPNLFFIPCGHLPPNPAELLSSAKMVSLLSLAAEKFDQVLIDCAPVLGLADALILGNLANGTILVVEAGATRRAHVQGAFKRLKVARTHVLGSLLSKFDSRQHAYGYGYSYSYYDYNYGAEHNKQLPT